MPKSPPTATTTKGQAGDRREFWVSECGGKGRLEFVAELGEVFPVDGGQGLSCVHLELSGDLINVVDCVVGLRYRGSDKWEHSPLPNQRVLTTSALLHALNGAVGRFSFSPVSTNGVEVWLEPTREQGERVVEFAFNRNLAQILGARADWAYSGRLSAQVNVFALVERMAVVSPHVGPSVTVNASELASLGTFRLNVSRVDGNVLSSQPLLSPSHSAPCIPGLLSKFSFSLVSLACPGLCLRADNFRLLAAFALTS